MPYLNIHADKYVPRVYGVYAQKVSYVNQDSFRAGRNYTHQQNDKRNRGRIKLYRPVIFHAGIQEIHGVIADGIPQALSRAIVTLSYVVADLL